MNLNDETPVDVAELLGDAVCLDLLRRRCRRRHQRSRGLITVPFRDAAKVDVKRILAVWERFFENAARTYVVPETATPSARTVDGYDHETGAPVGSGDEVGRTRVGTFRRRSADVCSISATHGSPYSAYRSGGEFPSREFSVLHEKSKGEIAFGAWEPSSPLGVERNQDWSCTRLACGEVAFSPWGGGAGIAASSPPCLFVDSDGGWSSSLSQYEDANMEARIEQVGGSGVDPSRETPWMAYWDREWEAVYYVNLKTGESSWYPPPEGVPPRVWDQETGAYFVVGEGGSSRWLEEEADAGNVSLAVHSSSDAPHGGEATENISALLPQGDPEPISTSVHASLREVLRDGEAGGRWWDALDVHPGAGETCSFSVWSPPTARSPDVILEGDDTVDDFHDTRQTLDYEKTGTSLEIPAYRGSSTQAHRSLLHPEDPSGHLGHEGLAHVNVRSGDCGEIHPHVSGKHESPDTLTVGGKEHEIVEFSTPRSVACGSVVPEWILWYTGGGGSAPYYVNEESGERSWDLPPALAETRGSWVRAWREGASVGFYVDRRTERVAGTLPNLRTSTG